MSIRDLGLSKFCQVIWGQTFGISLFCCNSKMVRPITINYGVHVHVGKGTDIVNRQPYLISILLFTLNTARALEWCVDRNLCLLVIFRDKYKTDNILVITWKLTLLLTYRLIISLEIKLN